MQNPHSDTTYDDLRKKKRMCEVLNSLVIYVAVFWDKAQRYVKGYQHVVRGHTTELRTGGYPVSFYERVAVHLAVIIAIVITVTL
jgi:hypothetical protein